VLTATLCEGKRAKGKSCSEKLRVGLGFKLVLFRNNLGEKSKNENCPVLRKSEMQSGFSEETHKHNRIFNIQNGLTILNPTAFSS